MRKLAFLLVWLVSQCSVRTVHAEPSKKQPRMVLVGDSLCQGAARPFLALSKKNGVSLSINCLHGTRIDYWSSRIEKVLNASRPQTTIISLGTNDSGLKNPEIQRHHVKKIIMVAKRYDTKILWLIPQKLPEKFKGQAGIRKILFEELKESEIFVSDHLNLEMIKDKIHMTGKGYDDWATAFSKRLDFK